MKSIVQVAALFTLLFIAPGGCRPETGDAYLDDADYADETNSQPDPGPSVSSEILTKPLALRVHVGDTVILPCNVSNSENVLIAWYKDRDVIYFGDNPYTAEPDRIKLEGNGSLVVNDFKQSDESDNYKCIITDTNEKISHSVRIYVPPATPTTAATHTGKLIVKPGEYTVVQRPNTNVTLSCFADWEPKPKLITWSFQGKRLTSDEFPPDGSNYTVRNVAMETIGLYQCLAGNKVGKINVLIKHAPRVEVEHKRIHAAVGTESEIKCTVHAYPMAEVVWIRNGMKITNGKNKSRIPISALEANYTLAISRTMEDDFGNYTCRATNKMGTANATVELTGTPAEAKFYGLDSAPDKVTPILKWIVNSHAPILEYELNYRQRGEDTWKTVTPKVTEAASGTPYILEYPLEGVEQGSYETVLYARNQYGWSPRDSKIHEFWSDYYQSQDLPASGESVSGGETARHQFLVFSRLLILAASLHVYTTYL
ncbi:limbic system-associated membrane protein isoform X1 [Neodiprion lecontei]|uniref:Limbic system-associated membrane protein isoform X1 n=1 Tax=Neodiprion lecontei TaxID=441921 RepID=A0A6J0C2L6_NEOLC|nr:limbic system-associated membrane protein isoform X1 [Neodiprion lecontei]